MVRILSNSEGFFPIPEGVQKTSRTTKGPVLPAAGYRNGNDGDTNVNNVGNNGNYWSSTPNDNNNAYNLNFNSGNVNPANNNNRNNAYAVRLVTASIRQPPAAHGYFRSILQGSGQQTEHRIADEIRGGLVAQPCASL